MGHGIRSSAAFDGEAGGAAGKDGGAGGENKQAGRGKWPRGKGGGGGGLVQATCLDMFPSASLAYTPSWRGDGNQRVPVRAGGMSGRLGASAVLVACERMRRGRIASRFA